MNNIKNKIYHTFILLVGISVSSCDLTNNLDEVKPPYQLEANKAITNAHTAELALAGAYSALQPTSSDFTAYRFTTMAARMGFTASLPGPFGFSGPEIINFYSNTPLTRGSELEQTYSGMYNNIARCNFVIEGVGKLKSTVFNNPKRKKEVIAEARALRALWNFYVLRLWGQFYDTNSKYGIVLKTSIYRNTPKARSTVAETYKAIHEDLDYAIKNAPDFKAKYYLNKTSAKAFKAKVHLYEGEYTKAATLAKEIMNIGGKYKMTKTFNEIFDKKTIKTLDNTEAIFCVYADEKDEELHSAGWGRQLKVGSTYPNLANKGKVTIGAKSIKYDSARVKIGLHESVDPFDGSVGYNNKKYIYDEDDQGKFDTMYHLRMAEIYLIYAEALARSGKSVPTEALEALNEVRKRITNVTVTIPDPDPNKPPITKIAPLSLEKYPAITDYKQFLKLVRIEKLMELAGEMGEHWYDLIRYDYLDGGFSGGFKVADLKPSAKNKDKFILPIPVKSMLASQKLVEQNPGY